MIYTKRLIEVDLPIKRISAHARREKSIRHGHISTLHIWWARRPLAACRAVICAALWPDPADPKCPQSFRDVAAAAMHLHACNTQTVKPVIEITGVNYQVWQQLTKKENRLDPKDADHQRTIRNLLLDFIADFACWESSSEPHFLEISRVLTQVAHLCLQDAKWEPPNRKDLNAALKQGTPDALESAIRGLQKALKDAPKPLVVDPFAGGGSIPLEALRVGADAFASDLNPVPVLLNKVVLEYIPKYGQRLADEVRKWGEWIKREAEKELAEFYPKDPDGATPIAYLWARTALSEAPASGNIPVQIPLLRTLWLSKRKDFQRALRWIRNEKGEIRTSLIELDSNGQTIKVRIPLLEIFTPSNPNEVEEGTAKGGSATCPITKFTTSAARVKEQLKQQRGGAQHSRLYAVYLEHTQGREFRIATQRDSETFKVATRSAARMLAKRPSAFPTEPINPIRPYKNTRGLSAVTRIGCVSFGDLYNQRQALSIRSFYDVLARLGHQSHDLAPGLMIAVQTALAFAVNRGVSQNTSMSRWDASRLTIKGAFSKQALAVVWDFAEANPFSGASADWDGAIEWVTKFIESNLGVETSGTIVRASATQIPLPSDSATALVTDPPYFAAIPYGDLSDFFYVWFKRGLADVYPELFSTELTEKAEELIVTNAQKAKDNRSKDDAFFRDGMAEALESARNVVQAHGVGVVVYAEGTTAGWEAILQAIINSDWVVTSSWPIDTEMENRTQAQDSASLQSSIHIICRPRENPDGSVRTDEIGDWRDVLQELPRRIHEWMPRLAEEGVVGADAIFACLGPALEIFSRYSRVEKASGEAVTLKEYLEQVWAAVAKEALALVFKGADTTGFEPDARLTAMFLWTLCGGDRREGPEDRRKDDATPSADRRQGPEDRRHESEDDDGGSDDEDDPSDSKSKLAAVKGGFVLEFDAARKIAQGLGATLEQMDHVVEVKGDKARLLPVSERARYLFGKEDPQPIKRGKKKTNQPLLFAELEELATETTDGGRKAPALGQTTLDRVHQAMLLFGAGRGEALKRFLVDDGAGKDARFWKLADCLNKLYPNGTDERRWVEGVLGRKKGLGF